MVTRQVVNPPAFQYEGEQLFLQPPIVQKLDLSSVEFRLKRVIKFRLWNSADLVSDAEGLEVLTERLTRISVAGHARDMVEMSCAAAKGRGVKQASSGVFRSRLEWGR